MLVLDRRLTCTIVVERTGSVFVGFLAVGHFNPGYRVECPSTESFDL